MRIFVDATTITPNRSGTGKYTHHMLQSLADTTPALDLLGATYPGAIDIPDRFNVVTQHTSAHWLLNRDLLGNRLRIEADVSLFPNYFMPFGWEIPSAVTIHDVSFLTHPQYYSRKFSQWYTKRIQHTVRKAHTILTVSEASAGQIRRHLGVKGSNIVVHPPIWLDKKDIVPPQRRQQALVYLGNMEPKKNVLRLIEAFRLSRLYDYRLILIGKLHADRAWSEMFLKMVRETPGVVWKGYVSDHEVTELVGSATGVLNVSHVEGFGLSQLDALSSGTPCLISNDPALMEISGGRSLYTDPDDTHEIARKMIELTTFDSEIARDNAADIQRHYTKKRYDDALMEVIDRLSPTPLIVFPGFGTPKPRISQGIVALSSYAAVFNHPISLSKIHLAFPDYIHDRGSISDEARQLCSIYPDIFSLNMNLFRNVSKGNNCTHESSTNHAEIRRQHHRLLRILGLIPCIRAVYFSGGTVHQSGLHDKPDVDLFIVSSKNCVWITYVLVRLISIVLRRKDSCCSNYLVDESAQCITWQRDFYTAFQLLFLKQVFRKKGTRHVRYYNSWIRDYFPNAPDWKITNDSTAKNEKPLALSTWFQPVFWINLLVMSLFAKRWRKQNKTNYSGGLNWDAFRIKLHNNDHRPHVYQTYREILLRTQSLLKGSVTIPDHVEPDGIRK